VQISTQRAFAYMDVGKEREHGAEALHLICRVGLHLKTQRQHLYRHGINQRLPKELMINSIWQKGGGTK